MQVVSAACHNDEYTLHTLTQARSESDVESIAHRYTLALQSSFNFIILYKMKNSFIKKVAVLSAGAVVLSSMSFFGVNAQQVDQETLLNIACDQAAAALANYHGVDFGSFDTSDVAGSFINEAGDKLHDDGTVSNIILPSAGTGILISVLDNCADTDWDVAIQLTNMSNSNGNLIFADNIRVVADGQIYLVDGTGPAVSANADGEIIGDIFDQGGEANSDGITVYAPSHTNVVWAGGSEPIMNRVTAGNSLGGEFGVDLTFSVTIPQYQPAGTYTGELLIDFNLDD